MAKFVETFANRIASPQAGGFCPRCIEEAFMELAVEEDENEELIRYSNSNWI